LEAWTWCTSVYLILEVLDEAINFIAFLFGQFFAVALLFLGYFNECLNMLQHVLKLAIANFSGEVVTNLENGMWDSSVAGQGSHNEI